MSMMSFTVAFNPGELMPDIPICSASSVRIFDEAAVVKPRMNRFTSRRLAFFFPGLLEGLPFALVAMERLTLRGTTPSFVAASTASASEDACTDPETFLPVTFSMPL